MKIFLVKIDYCYYLLGKKIITRDYCRFSESRSRQELISFTPLLNLVSDRYGHLTSVILVE